MTDAKPNATWKSCEAEASSAQLYLLDLFQRLGNGFLNLTSYKCSEALQEFSLLPPCHRDTAWVMSKIGKAYYEMANYVDVRISISKPS
jgi:anaphase-promoting complex subunit 3